MTKSYDIQKDIDAEGQRAAVFHAGRATDIDDQERPRYTTRRLRHEIEQAVLRERERCAAVARHLSSEFIADEIMKGTA